MKPASLSELKKEFTFRSYEELLGICIRMAKFNKENKQLLTYLLLESTNEASYVRKIKLGIDQEFEQMNTRSGYFTRKSIRRILKELKKYIRFSGKKETELELLIYFCGKFHNSTIPLDQQKSLKNLYDRQLRLIEKQLASLHQDLQYDFRLEMEEAGITRNP